MPKIKSVKDISMAIDDAVKILDKIDTPEVATKLVGKEREQYLKALDAVQGPKSTRISQDNVNLFHASKEDGFDKFKPSRGGYSGPGVYTSESKKGTNNYNVGGKVFDLILQDPKMADISTIDGLKSIAKELGVTDKLKANNWNQFYYDLQDAYIKKIDPDFKLVGNEKSEALNEAIKSLGYDSIKSKHQSDVDMINVIRPEKLREKEAAFDTRFKNSPLLMAGGAAIPGDMSPVPHLKKMFNKYEEIKNAAAEKFAEKFDLTKDGSATEDMGKMLSMAGDPINFMSGPIGLALGAGQVALTDEQESALKRRLNKIKEGK